MASNGFKKLMLGMEELGHELDQGNEYFDLLYSYIDEEDLHSSLSNINEASEPIQYGVHQFSTESIIFRGSEEECIRYIDERPELWDDAEVYMMTPDDPHYQKNDSLEESIYTYQTWVQPIKGEKQPSKTLTYGSDIVLVRSPYTREEFGRDWKRHINKIIEWSTENNPGLIRMTHEYRLNNFKDPNSEEAFIAAIEDKINKGEYILKESLEEGLTYRAEYYEPKLDKWISYYESGSLDSVKSNLDNPIIGDPKKRIAQYEKSGIRKPSYKFISVLTEEYIPDEVVELEYKDLVITQRGRQYDVDDWEELESTIDWTIKVDKEDLYTYIFEECIDVEDFPDAFETEFDPNEEKDWDSFTTWLDDNFDVIFTKYHEQILEHYEDKAREDAEMKYNPDDYIDWDTMPGGHDDYDIDESIKGDNMKFKVMSEDCIEKDCFEDTYNKLMEYSKNNPDYFSSRNLYDAIDNLSEEGIVEIPAEYCEDPENVTEEEASNYINDFVNNLGGMKILKLKHPVLREAKEENICCICNEPYEGYGNNAEPVVKNGRCCDKCNIETVLKKRIEMMQNSKVEEALTEALTDCKITYYLATATKERRPETREDIDNDYKEIHVDANDDFDALSKAFMIQRQIDDSDLSFELDNFDIETEDDFIRYFGDTDWSDGSILMLKVEGPNGVLYDTGYNKQTFIDELEDNIAQDKAMLADMEKEDPEMAARFREILGITEDYTMTESFDADSDYVHFYYDEDEGKYIGNGEIVTSVGETLKAAVEAAKADAQEGTLDMGNVTFDESNIDWEEKDLDDLGELKVMWNVAASETDVDDDYSFDDMITDEKEIQRLRRMFGVED